MTARTTKSKSVAEALGLPGKRSKFNAVRTEVDGIKFDSKAEARRFRELRLLLDAGRIAELKVHPKYQLHGWTPDGKNFVCSYSPDFSYLSEAGRFVVEDVKGGRATRTPLYRLKRKLFEGEYGLRITEVSR